MRPHTGQAYGGSLGRPTTGLRVLAHVNPLSRLVVGSRALAVGHFSDPSFWQALAVPVPLCALVLARATRVFSRAAA
jgi:hypothetical protein